MAQRKSPPPSRPAGKPGATPAKKVAGSRPNAAARPPVKKKPGKSIVNQKQTPWGLIGVTAAIAVFAIAIVIVVVVTRKSSSSDDSGNPYTHPEIAAAKAIKGVIYKAEPNHDHVTTTVKYNTNPPTGGNHSQIWADCDGSVYTKQIANENAVHMLEHGAVWITYRPGLAAAQIKTLTNLVNGTDRMAMSPYDGLKTPISLQAWNYQLFVNSASDPRIQQFIDALRNNPDTTPEPSATCSDPQFKAVSDQSTPGHPIFTLSS